MASRPLELTGTWEEILKHSGELTGQRVRLTVLGSAVDGVSKNGADAIRPASGQPLLRHAGTWAGDDLDDCLRDVTDSRAPVGF